MELQDTLYSRIDEIQKKLREANYQCNQLREEVKQAFLQQPQPQAEAPEKAPEVKKPPKVTQADVPVRPPQVKQTTTPPPPPLPQTRKSPAADRPPIRKEEKKASQPKVQAAAKPVTPPKQKSQAKRDWEKFIGENLINKIGIAILVIGIGIFVKFAIDKNWIGEIGRVAIGLGAGGLLLGVAHWLRTKYKAFSSVLIGGGLATLYFTITIAFQEYAIFSQTLAFVIMVVITAFAIAISLAYDRKEIAILALLGGFAAPFMVMSGSGNYVVLFTYLAILNVGITVLAWFKNWRVLNIIGYAATLLIFAGWLFLTVVIDGDPVPKPALIFGLVFFALFFVMFVLHNVRTGEKLTALEYFLLLSNSSIFFGLSMLIMENSGMQLYEGLLTAGMGVFHFAFILPIRGREKVDRNLIVLLIGLVLSFLTLAIPIQLEGSYITLFWAAEAALVLWLAQKTEIKLMKLSSLLISVLMLISLGWDWIDLYLEGTGDSLLLIANKAFITGVVSLASILTMQWLFKKENPEETIGGLTGSLLAKTYFYLGIIVMYLVGMLEFTYQVGDYIQNDNLVSVAFGTYNALFLSCLMLYARWKKIGFITGVTLVASSLVVIAYLGVHAGDIATLRSDITYNHGASGPFLFHYVFVALMLVMIFLNMYHIRERFGLQSLIGKITLWVTPFVLIFMASAELDHIIVLSGYANGSSVYELLETSRKVGYPILWGLCGFVMIFLGMRFKQLHLRIAALVLFLLTLIKLFVYDIQDVPPAGKIAAFVSLGILLLVISFMYQRLKLLLVNETKAKEEQAEKEAAARMSAMPSTEESSKTEAPPTKDDATPDVQPDSLDPNEPSDDA
jgi:uncharacterized membrane protein